MPIHEWGHPEHVREFYVFGDLHMHGPCLISKQAPAWPEVTVDGQILLYGMDRRQSHRRRTDIEA